MVRISILVCWVKQKHTTNCTWTERVEIHCIFDPMGILLKGAHTIGLMNAPACFQKFMESSLGEYRDDFAIPYLDDLLVYAGKFEDHLKHIRLVLQMLKKYGIKIKACKCQLFKREISYLGRVISANGYTIDPKNVDAVLGKLKKMPNNITELRSLLGLVGYF